MEKEYTRMFSIEKLYELIKEDTARIEVSPFETLLDNIIQEIEENAFCVGFKMAVNLMR